MTIFHQFPGTYSEYIHFDLGVVIADQPRLSSTELKTWKAYANRFLDSEVVTTAQLACGVTIIPDTLNEVDVWFVHAVDHVSYSGLSTRHFIS